MGEWPLLPQSRAQSVLQDKPLKDDLAKLGLKREEDLFTNANGKPDRLVFLLFIRAPYQIEMRRKAGEPSGPDPSFPPIADR
jgi:hypothetical protein